MGSRASRHAKLPTPRRASADAPRGVMECTQVTSLSAPWVKEHKVCQRIVGHGVDALNALGARGLARLANKTEKSIWGRASFFGSCPHLVRKALVRSVPGPLSQHTQSKSMCQEKGFAMFGMPRGSACSRVWVPSRAACVFPILPKNTIICGHSARTSQCRPVGPSHCPYTTYMMY